MLFTVLRQSKIGMAKLIDNLGVSHLEHFACQTIVANQLSWAHFHDVVAIVGLGGVHSTLLERIVALFPSLHLQLVVRVGSLTEALIVVLDLLESSQTTKTSLLVLIILGRKEDHKKIVFTVGALAQSIMWLPITVQCCFVVITRSNAQQSVSVVLTVDGTLLGSPCMDACSGKVISNKWLKVIPNSLDMAMLSKNPKRMKSI